LSTPFFKNLLFLSAGKRAKEVFISML
jgi:hypothetical protein